MHVKTLSAFALATAALAACAGISSRSFDNFVGMNIYRLAGKPVLPDQQDVTLVATALPCSADGFADIEAKAAAFDDIGVRLPDDDILWRLRQATSSSSTLTEVGTGGTATFQVDCTNVPRTSVTGPVTGHIYSLVVTGVDGDGDAIGQSISISIVPLPQ